MKNRTNYRLSQLVFFVAITLVHSLFIVNKRAHKGI